MTIGEAITYLISCYHSAVVAQETCPDIDDPLAFALWKTQRKVEEENEKCRRK